VNGLVNFFVLLTFLLATLTQTHQLGPGLGYTAAGVCAAIALVAAIARYKQRKGKDRGE
jgi:hypothetical protein